MSVKYTYKVYDSQGTYIKNLPINKVTSIPVVRETINFPGSPLDITIAMTLDEAGASVETDVLIDHLGDPIVDHLGDPMLASITYSLSELPIEPGNIVEVWQYDSYYVNGHRIYIGDIDAWEYSDVDKEITVKLIPSAASLDNYMMQTPQNTLVASQLTTDGYESINSLFPSPTHGEKTYIAQQVQVLSDVEINSIEVIANQSNLLMSIPSSATPLSIGALTVDILRGAPDTGIYTASSTAYINTTVDKVITLTFTTPVQFIAAETYSLRFRYYSQYYESINLAINSAGGYTSGGVYTYDAVNGWITQTYDMYFKVQSDNGAVGAKFLSKDPGYIVRTAMSTLNLLGGNVGYDNDTVQLCNTIVSYDFKFNTILEVVKKAQQLAPPNWYWFVDASENKLYFKRKGAAVDHTFIYKKHIETLDISRTTDDMVNDVWGSFGEVSGENIVARYTQASSVSKYKPRLKKISDNRVTVQSTADIVVKSLGQEKSSPSFRIKVTISASKYNIHTIRIGHTVRFLNVNNYIGYLRLHITEITRNRNSATLTLDSSLPSVSHRIEDIRRNLESLQTINNPDTI